MELLIFGHQGARVLVFPTRDGRFFDFENWGIVAAVAPRITAGEMQLYCVDSYDRHSLYADWMRPEDRIRRHLAFEGYLLDEVLPLSASVNPGSPLIAHGCSLGAYHAVNITLRHPSQFSRAVGFSGRYDLTISVGSFRGLFDGHYDDLVYYNNPSHFLPNVTEPELLDQMRRLEVVLAIGQDDAFLANNREFADVLADRGIPHHLYVWNGEAHRPRWWREMARLYL
jgi:esterase/lipase superfamily enzyme